MQHKIFCTFSFCKWKEEYWWSPENFPFLDWVLVHLFFFFSCNFVNFCFLGKQKFCFQFIGKKFFTLFIHNFKSLWYFSSYVPLFTHISFSHIFILCEFLCPYLKKPIFIDFSKKQLWVLKIFCLLPLWGIYLFLNLLSWILNA